MALITGWMVQGSNPSRSKTLQTQPDWTWGSRSLLYSGQQVSFLAGKSDSVALTTHPVLMPGSSMGRAIPLSPLCDACLACNGTAFIFPFTAVRLRFFKIWYSSGFQSCNNLPVIQIHQVTIYTVWGFTNKVFQKIDLFLSVSYSVRPIRKSKSARWG